MKDYKFVFKTKKQRDAFADYVAEEELWSKAENDTTLIVCSIYEVVAEDLYNVANRILKEVQ